MPQGRQTVPCTTQAARPCVCFPLSHVFEAPECWAEHEANLFFMKTQDKTQDQGASCPCQHLGVRTECRGRALCSPLLASVSKWDKGGKD